MPCVPSVRSLSRPPHLKQEGPGVPPEGHDQSAGGVGVYGRNHLGACELCCCQERRHTIACTAHAACRLQHKRWRADGSRAAARPSAQRGLLCPPRLTHPLQSSDTQHSSARPALLQGVGGGAHGAAAGESRDGLPGTCGWLHASGSNTRPAEHECSVTRWSSATLEASRCSCGQLQHPVLSQCSPDGTPPPWPRAFSANCRASRARQHALAKARMVWPWPAG